MRFPFFVPEFQFLLETETHHASRRELLDVPVLRVPKEKGRSENRVGPANTENYGQ